MARLTTTLLIAALSSAGPEAAAQPAAFSFAAARAAVADGRGAVKVLRLGSGKQVWTRKLAPLTVGAKVTPLAEVSCLAFSPDGRKLAVGGGVLYHGHVALLDAAAGQLLWVKRDVGPQQQVSLAFSPDGKTVCAGSLGGPAVLLDAGTGELRRTLAARGIESVAFSPDGKRVAAGCRGAKGAEVRLWEAATGRLVRSFPRGRGAVAFSRDGKLLATACEGHAVSVWDAGTGELRRSLKGKPAGLITFSPDGKVLASVEAASGALSLWDARSGELLRQLGGPVSAAAFSPDGKAVVAWKSGQGLRRWEVAQAPGGKPGK